MGDRLDEYRRKRDARRTPEPVPQKSPRGSRGDRFVIQQHHARRLHWDLRLEHNGVLVSWAVPRGLPPDPARNHLAVHTEDHPLEYLDFHGEIPAGEYGGGRMTIHDRGTYTAEKWRDDEVIVVLRGKRTSGRYVLFHTKGRDWMVHRMDPPQPGWTPMPEQVRPMTAVTAAKVPLDDEDWAYEMRWSGMRALAYVSGGRLRLVSGDDEDVTGSYRELRDLAETLAPTECLLDGVVVALGADTSGDARAASRKAAVQYMVFDLLWLDGKSTMDVSYADRRELLGGLDLAGPHWQTPPHFAGGGRFALQTSREQGLGGVVAKRLDSPYLAGRRTRRWLELRNDRDEVGPDSPLARRETG